MASVSLLSSCAIPSEVVLKQYEPSRPIEAGTARTLSREELSHTTETFPDLRVRRHIPALDGLRGLAVLMVMLVHLGGGRHSPHLALRVVADALRLGWAGVALFFVLSGFLITGILWDSFREPSWWKRFYIRRSLRIFPLYYLALAYAAIVLLCLAPSALRAIPVYALYLQDTAWVEHIANLLPEQIVSLGALWSLAVEEQFYLIWPLILFSCRRRRGLAMTLCVIGVFASLSFRLLLVPQHASYTWTYRSLPARAGELLIGAWIALAIRGSIGAQQRLFRYVPIVCLASCAALAALTFATKGSFETTEPLWLGPGLLALPLFMGTVLLQCLRPTTTQRLLRSPVLRWFGTISYGLYVFQSLLTPAFHHLADSFGLRSGSAQAHIVESFISFAGATLLAWLSFSTFERYFLRLKDRLHT